MEVRAQGHLREGGRHQAARQGAIAAAPAAAAPPGVGIGLRAPHYAALLERGAPLGFVEVHSENFFGAGGAALAWLERFRGRYALSLHGVGLSLGSSDPLDARHLAALAALAARFEPAWVSEHLSWSSVGGRHAHELLPLPHTPQAAAHVAARIARVQDLLRREILVENVSAYLRMPGGTMPEWDFVAEVQRRSGCRLLLDVNNVWVNASHHGFDPRAYLEALAPGSVGEIHLGGYEDAPEGLVDTHGAAVSEPVWALYEAALARFGPVPTLIEWDQGLPPLEVLLAEAARAARLAGASEAQAA